MELESPNGTLNEFALCREARSARFDVARRPCRCQKSGVGKKAGLRYDQIV